MQPGLVSSSQQTILAGKMVYELVDPSKPSSQASSVTELPTNNLSLLDGSTQLLLNTTDAQPQDTAALFAGPFATLHTVAGNVYNASKQQGSGLLTRDIPTRTKFENARRERERRPKRPARNITLVVGNDKNHGESLQSTHLVWVFAALALFVVV